MSTKTPDFPVDFDPLTVTEVILNTCYFNTNAQITKAEEMIKELFPKAEQRWFLHDEDLSLGVMGLNAGSEMLPFEIQKALEDFLPKGQFRKASRLFR